MMYLAVVLALNIGLPLSVAVWCIVEGWKLNR